MTFKVKQAHLLRKSQFLWGQEIWVLSHHRWPTWPWMSHLPLPGPLSSTSEWAFGPKSLTTIQLCDSLLKHRPRTLGQGMSSNPPMESTRSLCTFPKPRRETSEDANRTEIVGKIPGMVKSSEFSREAENLDVYVWFSNDSNDFKFFCQCSARLPKISMSRIESLAAQACFGVMS